MDKHLQKIFNFIQQNNTISTKEKKTLVEAVTIQDRESQIQVALEKVRNRTMAMQKTSELVEAGELLYRELSNLGIPSLTSGYVLIDKDEEMGWNYTASPIDSSILPKPVGISQTETKVMRSITTSWKNQEPFHIVELSPKETIKHQTFIAECGINFPYTTKELLSQTPERLALQTFNFKQGYLLIAGGEKLSTDQVEIMIRFTKEFDRTYRRFLDLQKAEAQAREAQIEAALEKVRSRMMGMQKSSELEEASIVMHQQFNVLSIVPEGALVYIVVIDSKTETAMQWTVNDKSNVTPKSEGTQEWRTPMTEHPELIKTYKAWKHKDPILIRDLSGEKLKEFGEYIISLPSNKGKELPLEQFPDRMIWTEATFSQGTLGMIHFEPLPEATLNILIRFSKVFELTYKRFLDLKLAEEQAREAQIEVALERVRAKSMAMHKSEELLDVIKVVSKQLQKLNFKFDNVSFGQNNQEHDYNFWLSFKGHPDPVQIRVPFIDNPVINSLMEAHKNNVPFLANTFSPSENKEWTQHMINHGHFTFLPKKSLNYILNNSFTRSSAILQNIQLFVGRYGSEPFTTTENKIIIRFAQVFEQTFIRFLDLQKAEKQAREAEIEVALERVRSRSMGMQKSEELYDVIQVIYNQLILLNFDIDGSGFAVDFRDSNDWNLWTADRINPTPSKIHIPYFDHPMPNAIIEAKKNGIELLVINLTFEEKNSMWENCFKYLSVSQEVKDAIYSFPGYVMSKVLLEKVDLYIYNFTGFLYTDEENAILLRFGKVFEQTYVRFNDLKQAEVRAKEALKQSSLDRVRAEIASMRTASDLERITPLIWKELTTLGVNFYRCGVFIIDEKAGMVRAYLSVPTGESLAALHLDLNTNSLTKAVYSSWKKQSVYQEVWTQKQFIDFTKSMMDLGQIKDINTFQQGKKPPKKLILHLAPFKQGMLYVGNTTPLSKDQIELVQSLANTFAGAYSRYEDFNQLEQAKRSIENTLSELKSAQSQLIQSEKMASLGELTAGIAHEIQNPLNFVNNFSEVSEELLDELEEELSNNSVEDIKEILKDLKQNLNKINHHGKRASGIVKGMLDHSRTSSGERVLTDINVLADEYLRLSYHGLRAKDRTFSADFKAALDENIPKISIVAQDFGRVILNLINNAFYAVSEKAKKTEDNYQPTVIVTTKKLDKQIQISVKDNGNGIPKELVDKIFQPFFTTKPTGEGTGLGLSLSYDIVKAHGGELTIETKEEVGSTFTIKLPLA